MKTFKTLLFVALTLVLFSCSDNDEAHRSSEKEILSFSIYNDYRAMIDEPLKQINLTLPYDVDITSLTPSIEISPKATISPATEVAQDFSKPVVYTVQAEDGSKQQYTVKITLEKSVLNKILNFSIKGVKGNVESNSVLIWLKGVSDVTQLEPIIEVSAGAKISPASGEKVDFSNPVTYTVTAENGDVAQYTVGVQYDVFPSGHLYTDNIIYTNQTQDVSVYCVFNFNGFGQVSSFTKTSIRFYIGDNLVDGSVTYIKYDGSNNKISQLVFTERKNNVEVSSRTLNVTYPQDKIIYVTEQLNGGVAKQDIITLNDRGKVSKFETDGRTEYYVYDKFDNLVEHTTEGQGYKKIDYDTYNGVFTHLNVPQWIFLYTTGELIGTGTNNPLTIDRYGQNKDLVETITYDYKYMPRTRYPVSRTYQIGNDTFTDGIQFFKYIFPYKLNLAADRD